MKRTLLSAMLAVSVGFFATFAYAGKWVPYKSETYGFSMKIPPNAKVKSKTYAGGWGVLWAKSGPATVWGVAKLGKKHSASEISQFGVKVSGVAEKHWTRVSKGKNRGGWNWYHIYRAAHKRHVVWAAIGTGDKGSFLIFLKTTKKDARKYAKKYLRWVNNVTLH